MITNSAEALLAVDRFLIESGQKLPTGVQEKILEMCSMEGAMNKITNFVEIMYANPTASKEGVKIAADLGEYMCFQGLGWLREDNRGSRIAQSIRGEGSTPPDAKSELVVTD